MTSSKKSTKKESKIKMNILKENGEEVIIIINRQTNIQTKV